MKRIFSPDSWMIQEGLTFIRIITGLLMAYHGWEVFDHAKMEEYAKWESFNSYASPSIMVYIGKGAELIAGVLMTLGLLTRVAALVLVITMLYICFKIGNGRFWYEDQHPFLFVLIGMVYFFAGGGKYSMDSILFKRK
ncbi:MAG: DoxX family protein [Chitinophagaceae bacterium]|nr:DoxX family protein [Chitinophagaceae bacterium]